MNKKKYIFIAFLLVGIVQIAVPAKMIMESEGIILLGEEFKFRAAPVDPSDPFRGKFITLNYKDNSVKLKSNESWHRGDLVYVTISADSAGYAIIETASHTKPDKESDYVTATVEYFNTVESILVIEYHFDRFYMEESKAYKAERIYRDGLRDSTKQTYALVSVKKGNAVLRDVLIDDVSIKDIVESQLD